MELRDNEIRFIIQFPKNRNIGIDKLFDSEGKKSEVLQSLMDRGLVKKDEYWVCWLTHEGRQLLKKLKDEKINSKAKD
jgi:hypothetical protein